MRELINRITLWLNRKRSVYFLILAAFIIRAGFGIAIGQRYLPMADQIVFDELAKNLCAGRGLMVTDRLILPPEDAPDEIIARYHTRPERIRDLRLNALWGVVQPGKPTAFVEPMVPLIFASIYKVFGPNLVFPRIFHSLLDALVAGMIFSLGIMALPRSRAPGIAALIYTFYPFSIMFTGALITQPIYLFLQCASIYLFYRFMREPRWSTALVFGLAFGITILVRISILTFAPIFLIALAVQDYSRVKLLPVMASFVLAGLLLIPWAYRNQNDIGKPLVLPTKGGRNFWEYNNQHFSLERLRAEGLFGVDAVYQKFAHKRINQIKGKQYIEFPEFTTESEIERNQILNHNVKEFIRLNPKIYIELCFLRFYQFFRVTPTHHQGLFFKLTSWASFGWILPLSIFGGLLLLKHWRRMALIYLLIFYNIGIHTLTASGIPHRLPIDPFLILLASYGLCWMGNKIGGRKELRIMQDE